MGHFTPIPNQLFDNYVYSLSGTELKILLLIIRKTYGWVDPKTNSRIKRIRLTHRYIHIVTGISRRMISPTIQSLIDLQLVSCTDYYQKNCNAPDARKGNSELYYEVNFNSLTKTHNPMQ